MLSPDDCDDALCRRVLTEYPQVLDVDRSESIRIVAQGGGFSGAGVFHVERPSAAWCLRRWPAGSLPPARLRELHRWLRFLKEEGLPVAVPVTSRTGDTLAQMDGTDWQLEPWLPGRSDVRSDPSDIRLRQAMHTLARLHLVSPRYRAQAGGADWFALDRGPSPAVQERLTRLQTLTPLRLASWRDALRQHPGEFPSLLRETMDLAVPRLPQVAARLRSYGDVSFLRSPCWRDLWHDHVLFQENSVTGLVDPSAARTDTPAVDLARLLGSFLGNPSPRWQTAFAMYSEIRGLNAEEQQLAMDLDFSGLVLSPFTWVGRFLESPARVNSAEVASRVLFLKTRLQQIG